jgi:hypothetical protein
MVTHDLIAITSACPISVEELPITGTPDEQAQFLREYLAHARASGDYECYECVEHILTKLEAAETSPFMDA